MKTRIWGRATWRAWHAIAHAYPEQPTEDDKRAAVAYFSAHVRLLPCDDCKQHLPAEFARDPVQNHVGSRDELARWTFNFHNRVNARLGKPIANWDDVVAFYRGDGNSCAADCGCDDDAPAPAARAEGARDASAPLALLLVLVGALALVTYLWWGARQQLLAAPPAALRGLTSSAARAPAALVQ